MTNKLYAATNFVLLDERVWWFAETWQRTAAFGDRRIQRMTVKRGDGLAIYEEDVGPFDKDKDHVFNAPCFWQYSVAEMQELAQLSRDSKPLREPEEHLDLKAAAREDLEERIARKYHRSIVGPHFRKERH